MITETCDQTDLANAIQAQPGISKVLIYEVTDATPLPSDFAKADIVVGTGGQCDTGYEDAATYGDRLADYVDHGGAVLETAYDNWEGSGAAVVHPTGRFASGHYAPLTLGPNDNIATALGTVLKPKSAIVQGLGTFTTNDNTTTPLAQGATLLAKWADGRNAIAMKGHVVATSASTNDDPSIPAVARLARNTAVYFNVVPGTKITKATVRGSSAAFTFKALGPSTGFLCGLTKVGNKGRLRACPSHKKYRNLKPGKYTFAVAAFGPAGVDRTPAKKSFTIAG